MAQSKRITVRRPPPEATASVYAPDEALRSVLMNLVSNALKYTPEGGQVQVEWVDAPEAVTLWVTDTGYGIPPEDLPHLFTKFYRARTEGAPERIPGSGLGLSIAHKAVQAMGGRMWVVSEVGKGSTFCVELPKGREGL